MQTEEPSGEFSRNQLGMLWIALLLAVLCGFTFAKFGLPKLGADVRDLYPLKSQALSDLNAIERTFGRTLVDILLVPLSDPVTEDEQENVLELEEKLLGLDGILSVTSPAVAFRNRDLPLRLISEDRKYGRFILEIPSDLPESDRSKLSGEIEIVRPKGSLRAGTFFASEVATKTLEKENRKWAPLCVVSIFTFLLLFVRHLGTALRIMIPALLSAAIVAAVLSLLQLPLGAISQLVPPLLLAIATSYSCYIATRVISAPEGSTHLPGVVASTVLAAVTTIVGFISLVWIGTVGVTQFALIMAFGTALSALLSLVYVPILMSSLSASTLTSFRNRFSKMQMPWTQRPFLVCAPFLLPVLGLVRLNVNTGPLDFFKDRSVEKAEILTVEEKFPGSRVLSVMFEFNSALNDQTLEFIERIEERLRKLDNVVSVTGAPEFHKAYTELRKRDETAMIPFREFGPLAITSDDLLSTRLIVDNDLDGNDLIRLAADVSNVITNVTRVPSVKSIRVSSRELVVSQQARHLSLGLYESVITALVIVAVLILLLFRSIKIAAISLIPSLLPIVCIFGLMGYVDPTLNLGAALVASSALGTCSDYTFHLLMLWRAEGATYDALVRAQSMSVAPFLFTGLALVVGFSPTDFSSVPPVREFGLLLGSSLALGIFLNLYLLPPLLAKAFFPLVWRKAGKTLF